MTVVGLSSVLRAARVAAALFLVVGAFTSASLGQSEAAARTQKFLTIVSTAPETTLRAIVGMPPEAVPKILAQRKSGGPFRSIDQFKTAAGLTDEQLKKVTAPYVDAPPLDADERASDGSMNPSQTPRPSTAKGGGKKSFGEGKPATADSTKSAAPQLDLEVKSDYYAILPGYDLSKMDDAKKKTFLDTINHEQCSCGCTGETLAWCLVNDPGCPVVKARVKKVYTDTFGQPPPASGQH